MKRYIFLLLALSLYGDEGERLFNKHGCYGCHGVGGKGGTGYPVLEGRTKTYLINRLKAYKKGKIRSNRASIMIPYAKALSDEEIEKIAEYLSKPKKEEHYDPEYEPTDII